MRACAGRYTEAMPFCFTASRIKQPVISLIQNAMLENIPGAYRTGRRAPVAFASAHYKHILYWLSFIKTVNVKGAEEWPCGVRDNRLERRQKGTHKTGKEGKTDGRGRQNSSRSGIRNKRDSFPLKFVGPPARSGESRQPPSPVTRRHVPQHCLIKVQLKHHWFASCWVPPPQYIKRRGYVPLDAKLLYDYDQWIGKR